MRYVAGWDGGGTKTAVTIADESGTVIHAFNAGPLNYNGQDAAKVQTVISGVCAEIARLCGGIDQCVHMCIGAAGISNPDVAGRLTGSIRASGYDGGLTLVGDHVTALCGAHESPYGMIVIAGTGSIGYGASPSGATQRAGGYGHLIDDEGSGYAIGRDLLAAVVRSEDGRAPATAIAEPLFEQLGLRTVGELVGFVYSKGTNKKDIAALAPLLSLGCEAQDTAALEIAEKAGRGLAELAIAVADRLTMREGALAIAGSVLQRNRFVRDVFVRKVADRLPKLQCIEPKRDAAYGAMLLAHAEWKSAAAR